MDTSPSGLSRVYNRLLPAGVNVVGAGAAVGIAAVLAAAFMSSQLHLASVALGFIALLLLLAAAPSWGLLIWVLLAPFYRFFVLDMGAGLPNLGLHRVVALSLLLLLIAQRAAGQRKLARLTAIEGLGGLFVLGLLLSVPASHLGIVGGVQNVFDYWILPVLWFYFARNLLGSKQWLGRLAMVIAIAGAVMGLIAAREQLTHLTVLSPIPYQFAYGRYTIKINSLFGSPAVMSMTLAMTVPAAFLGAIRSRTLGSRIAWSVALVAIFAGLLLTYVRGGWLAAILCLIVPILLSRRAQRYILYLTPVILLLAVLATYGTVDTGSIEERLQSQKSIDYRVEAIEVGLQIAARSAVFGIGLDNFSEAALASGLRHLSVLGIPISSSHNMFIYILTSAGLVGLLPLLALLGLMGWRALRLLRTRGDPDWPAGILGLLLGYVGVGLTFDAESAQLACIYLFMLTGAVFGAYESEQDNLLTAAAP